MSTTTTLTESHYAMPSATIMQELGELPILNESGKTLPLKSLWTGENANGRQVIIFVRHFLCGLCENYVQELGKELSQSKLNTLTPPVKLSIIGCGQPSLTRDWKQRTQCEYPIYCDPERNIYAKLGMVENLGMGSQKPEYQKLSVFSTSMNSAWNAMISGTNPFKVGNFSQNGGELLFEDGELKWCHRMKNTRDHAEISELKQVLKM